MGTLFHPNNWYVVGVGLIIVCRLLVAYDVGSRGVFVIYGCVVTDGEFGLVVLCSWYGIRGVIFAVLYLWCCVRDVVFMGLYSVV